MSKFLSLYDIRSLIFNLKAIDNKNYISEDLYLKININIVNIINRLKKNLVDPLDSNIIFPNNIGKDAKLFKDDVVNFCEAFNEFSTFLLEPNNCYFKDVGRQANLLKSTFINGIFYISIEFLKKAIKHNINLRNYLFLGKKSNFTVDDFKKELSLPENKARFLGNLYAVKQCYNFNKFFIENFLNKIFVIANVFSNSNVPIDQVKKYNKYYKQFFSLKKEFCQVFGDAALHVTSFANELDSSAGDEKNIKDCAAKNALCCYGEMFDVFAKNLDSICDGFSVILEDSFVKSADMLRQDFRICSNLILDKIGPSPENNDFVFNKDIFVNGGVGNLEFCGIYFSNFEQEIKDVLCKIANDYDVYNYNIIFSKLKSINFFKDIIDKNLDSFNLMLKIQGLNDDRLYELEDIIFKYSIGKMIYAEPQVNNFLEYDNLMRKNLLYLYNVVNFERGANNVKVPKLDPLKYAQTIKLLNKIYSETLDKNDECFDLRCEIGKYRTNPKKNSLQLINVLHNFLASNAILFFANINQSGTCGPYKLYQNIADRMGLAQDLLYIGDFIYNSIIEEKSILGRSPEDLAVALYCFTVAKNLHHDCFGQHHQKALNFLMGVTFGNNPGNCVSLIDERFAKEEKKSSFSQALRLFCYNGDEISYLKLTGFVLFVALFAGAVYFVFVWMYYIYNNLNEDDVGYKDKDFEKSFNLFDGVTIPNDRLFIPGADKCFAMTLDSSLSKLNNIYVNEIVPPVEKLSL